MKKETAMIRYSWERLFPYKWFRTPYWNKVPQNMLDLLLGKNPVNFWKERWNNISEKPFPYDDKDFIFKKIVRKDKCLYYYFLPKSEIKGSRRCFVIIFVSEVGVRTMKNFKVDIVQNGDFCRIQMKREERLYDLGETKNNISAIKKAVYKLSDVMINIYFDEEMR